MKNQIFFKRAVSILAVAGMLMGFAPMAEPAQQSNDVTINITQVDNSKFPMVTVYVSVVNSKGEPVAVNPNALIIQENGKTIPASNLEGAGEVGPSTTLLVMDISGSMNKGGKLDAAKSVAKEYIQQMRDGDMAGIVLFNTSVRTLQVLKNSKADLLSAIDEISAGGDTAMYDALVSSVNMLNSVSGRKAILVYTDGLDNRSSASLDTVISEIGKGGLTISTVGFGDVNKDLGSQESLDEGSLKRLAQESGGRYGFAANRDELSALYASYGHTMRSEYALTYQSPYGLRNGINRSLTVTLDPAYSGGALSGASATYNPGGLIPEVPVGGSWSIFFILLAILGLLTVGPMLLPLAQERIQRPKANVNVKLRQTKKVAIKFKD
ncbi:MAG: VWA domain-containing protein [Leptolinea sp.]|nr:VWA domain-containing protein [Leptolinea sp.]